MSGARPVRIDLRQDVVVGDAVATVLVAEGSVQLIWHRGLPQPLAGQAFWNGFITAGTGDQLRALAAAVDSALALQSEAVK